MDLGRANVMGYLLSGMLARVNMKYSNYVLEISICQEKTLLIQSPD
jgi:hypothetical protein